MSVKKTVSTWDQDVELFVNLPSKRRSDNTKDAYRRDLADFKAWYIGRYEESPELHLLNEVAAAEWMDHMERDLQHKPASINRRMACLKSLIKWGRERGRVGSFDLPSKAEEVIGPPKWLDRSGELLLVRTARDSRSRLKHTLIVVGLNTGLRVAELADLKWTDITMTDKGGQLIVRRGKGRKRRPVNINPPAKKALRDYGYTDNKGSDSHVFIGQKGHLNRDGIQGPLTSKGIQKIAAVLGEKAGLIGFSAARHASYVLPPAL